MSDEIRFTRYEIRAARPAGQNRKLTELSQDFARPTD
jgi:hypothetical protein